VRVLLFTGKGGVGKTTASAATALHLAASGRRVVVTSADPAHSLADAFGCELGPEPVEVAPGCRAQQLDARERFEEAWGDIRDWLLEVLDWAGADAIEAEELAVLPGLDELFALTEIEALCASGDHDVVVVDCAPTAETIRLLSLPDVLGWYMDRLFPASRRLNRVVGPVLGRLTSLPVAGDTVFRAGRQFYDRLDAVHRILADPATTTARLVVNPERMVVAEARRTLTYLSLFGYHVDAVVMNRVLPEAVSDPWFDEWRRTQAVHLADVESDFAPLPVLRAELAPREILGNEALAEWATALWEGIDPADHLVTGAPLRLRRDGEDHVLTVDLPFAERGELDVTQVGDELVITLGALRRVLALPDSLRRKHVGSARLVEGRLQVRFTDPTC
jgi:arsenite/tail-anchored protein-transporting ATPase